MSTQVRIFTKVGCPYCAAAKKHYTENGVTFEEVDVHEVRGAEAELLKLTNGERIVPVIVGDGQTKIGFGGG
ncbi:MAG: glutaredoxin family protein [bacterium]